MKVRLRRAHAGLLFLGAVAILVGLGAGLTAASGSSSLPDTRTGMGGWPNDTNGDGVISDTGSERIPEFIKAVVDGGVEGYVRYEDLQGLQPSNPAEALAMSGKTRVIPLYATDGMTVIGTYTLSAGDQAADPPTPPSGSGT